jgi:hypothetical protein
VAGNGNTIGPHNVISGNTDDGIHIRDATGQFIDGTRIIGNLIGTDFSGTVASLTARRAA